MTHAEQALSQLRRVSLRIPFPTLRGRAWVIALPILFGVIGGMVATQLQAREYRGQAQVVVRVQPVRPEFWQEQANVAQSPELAKRVVVTAGVPGMTAERFLRHASVSLPKDADSRGFCIDLCPELAKNHILRLSFSDQGPAAAVRLANAYAAEFVRLRREHDERPLDSIRARMRVLRARGQAKRPLYRNLAQQELQVQLLLRQFVSYTAFPANDASPFRPHALRNGLVGGVLGALLGIALALLVLVRRARKT